MKGDEEKCKTQSLYADSHIKCQSNEGKSKKAKQAVDKSKKNARSLHRLRHKPGSTRLIACAAGGALKQALDAA